MAGTIANARTETLRPRGDLDVDAAGALFEDLLAASRRRSIDHVCIDFHEVGELTSAAVASITAGRRLIAGAGKTSALVRCRPHHAQALALRPDEAEPAPASAPSAGFFESVGARVRDAHAALVAFAELTVDTLEAAIACVLQRERTPWGSIRAQAVAIGVDALPILAMLSFLLGVVLAFQTIVQLEYFGAASFTNDVVSLGMTREFGPFITAIVVAGRSGSAIAAELATMEMREENDALRTMGLSPVRLLVLPRMLALTLVVPALSLLSMIIGMFGGVLTTSMRGMSWVMATGAMVEILSLDDFWLGLVKSLLFAWTIGLVGCYQGMHARGGARGVGSASTHAVVASIFFVIVIDSIVTTAWTMGAGA